MKRCALGFSCTPNGKPDSRSPNQVQERVQLQDTVISPKGLVDDLVMASEWDAQMPCCSKQEPDSGATAQADDSSLRGAKNRTTCSTGHDCAPGSHKAVGSDPNLHDAGFPPARRRQPPDFAGPAGFRSRPRPPRDCNKPIHSTSHMLANNRLMWTVTMLLGSLAMLTSSASAFSVDLPSRALRADELGVPVCPDNSYCVAGGVCVKDDQGAGRCMCSSSCPLSELVFQKKIAPLFSFPFFLISSS